MALNTLNQTPDLTVQVFDQFYDLDLVVGADEYEVVLSFFSKYTSSEREAKSFAQNLFRVSNITQIPVLDLLSSFQGTDSMQITATMAYYLNSLGNKTTLFGVQSPSSPNNLAQRNVVQ